MKLSFANSFVLLAFLVVVPTCRADLSAEELQNLQNEHMVHDHHTEDWYEFNAGTFFKMHDANQDGYWDQKELAAIYAAYAIEGRTADELVADILRSTDFSQDGFISLQEYVSATQASTQEAPSKRAGYQVPDSRQQNNKKQANYHEHRRQGSQTASEKVVEGQENRDAIPSKFRRQ